MNRVLLLITALMALGATLLIQISKDEHVNSHEPIEIKRDIPYAETSNPKQRLDLYLPRHRESLKLPVIFYIHGGGWMMGDKSAGAGFLRPFIRTGQYAGVSVAYRLSDEAIWPSQIHDCKAAIRWVRANASKYGFDVDHIGVWGRSAGGHLALMLGVAGDVRDLEGNIGPHSGFSSKVAAVVNFFGVTDIMAIIGQPSVIDRLSPNSPEAMLIGGDLKNNPDKAKFASPITFVTSKDPPVLTVHGTADLEVPYDQAVRIDTALKNAGVPSYLVPIQGGGHGDFGTKADNRVKIFFDKYLRGKTVDVPTETITEWKR